MHGFGSHCIAFLGKLLGSIFGGLSLLFSTLFGFCLHLL